MDTVDPFFGKDRTGCLTPYRLSKVRVVILRGSFSGAGFLHYLIMYAGALAIGCSAFLTQHLYISAEGAASYLSFIALT